MSDGLRVWIQGAGEMASATAATLVARGHQVVLAEISNPLAVRRLVCFSEAVYEGSVTVGQWPGRLVSTAALEFESGCMPVVIDPEARQLVRLGPDIVVDARMTKQEPVLLPRGSTPLIGLGPGFRCGIEADLVVETVRGAELGRVITKGAAKAYTGFPGPVAGATVSRLLRAPAAGNLTPVRAIGDLVREGEIVGHVAGMPVAAGLGGKLRGLIHPRAELVRGEKVGDVDPRGAAVDPSEMTDKALRVALGVAEAIELLAGNWSKDAE